jgi:aspartate racemase
MGQPHRNATGDWIQRGALRSRFAKMIRMRNLGLIGGLGPVATVHYYRELVRAQAGEMLIVHADMDRVLGDVRRGDRIGLAAYFARLIERLARGGAELAAISAVTPHICIAELEKITPLPLVNIVKEIETEIRSRGYRRVALFGTRFVVESRMFGMLSGVEVVVPDQVEAIHEAYMRAVEGGAEGRDILTRIAMELPVDAVVLAGTDLSPIFDESNSDFAHVDSARTHIGAILRALAEPPSAAPLKPGDSIKPAGTTAH